MNKPVLVTALALIVFLSSLAYVLSRNPAQPPVPTHNTSEISALASKPASLYMAMNILPTYRLVPVGGNANFTLVLYSGDELRGNYSISAIAPPGLAFTFGPVPFPVSGAGPHFGDMTIRSSGEMNPGNYNVTILAKGSAGVANQTFGFSVQRNVILLTALERSVTRAFSNLTLKVGDSLTWVSLDAPLGDEEESAYHQVYLSNALSNLNSTSGHLHQYNGWSYVFTQPGVYRWYDSVDLNLRGQVIVTPSNR